MKSLHSRTFQEALTILKVSMKEIYVRFILFGVFIHTVFGDSKLNFSIEA